MSGIAFSNQILRLKEEVETLTRDRDRFRRESDSFRQIANTAEDETERRRISYLKLEAKYEEERKAGFGLEMALATTHTPEPADVSPEKRLVDIGVGTQDGSVAEGCHTDGRPLRTIDCQPAKTSENLPLGNRREELGPENDGKDATPSGSRHTTGGSPRVTATDRGSNSPLSTASTVVASPLRPEKSPGAPTASGTPPSSRNTLTGNMISPSPAPGPARRVVHQCPRRPLEEFTWPRMVPPDPTDISRYIRGTPNFSVYPPPQTISISRRALTRTYGLPGMGFLWASKDRRYKFLLPTYEVNPNMPRAPGQPGLLISCREEMWNTGPWTLFVKVGVGNKPRLNYAGEYTCRSVGKLTGREFAAQSQSVKESWGTKISEHKRHPVYRDIRARMTLRKRPGYEPTPPQVSYESERIKAKGYVGDLTCQDVIAALERGDEQLDVVKLVCVSYSHRRAQAYVEAQVEYEDYIAENPPRKRRREDYEDHLCTV